LRQRSTSEPEIAAFGTLHGSGPPLDCALLLSSDGNAARPSELALDIRTHLIGFILLSVRRPHRSQNGQRVVQVPPAASAPRQRAVSPLSGTES
jgi:hypothetical protein